MPYLKGVQDVIAQPLYDWVPAAMAGQSQVTFFSLPIGQGTTNFGTGTKTLRDTNLRLAGQIPSGYFFTLYGFRIAYPWNIVTADFQIITNSAVFVFNVGSKAFLEVPCNSIPSGNGPFFSGSLAAAATAAFPTSGWPTMANGFSVGRKPLPIDPTMNFNCQVLWPGGVTALSAATTIGIYLDGILRRPAQ